MQKYLILTVFGCFSVLLTACGSDADPSNPPRNDAGWVITPDGSDPMKIDGWNGPTKPPCFYDPVKQKMAIQVSDTSIFAGSSNAGVLPTDAKVVATLFGVSQNVTVSKSGAVFVSFRPPPPPRPTDKQVTIYWTAEHPSCLTSTVEVSTPFPPPLP
jgi:hypothetical protein